MKKNKRIKNFLKQGKNIYFGKGTNSKYLTEFESSNLIVFWLNSKWVILTDMRYFEALKNKKLKATILNISSQKDKLIFKTEFLNSKTNQIYFDASITTVEELERLKLIFKRIDSGIEFIALHDFDQIRLIKSNDEIKNTKFAISETDKIFSNIINFIKVGMTEKDIEKEIRRQILFSPASKESFSPIVAAGINSSNPHWEATDYVIKKGDLIVLDFGQFYKNSCSDMTRTIIIGKDISDKQKEVYQIVKEAQIEAIKAAKPGITASELDSVAREYIEKRGYGEYFIHSLGHGIGYEIHESPNISKNQNLILESGMIITIEPGIYLPNEFGIRIEDDILITNDGNINLTNSKKEIIFI